MSKQLKKAPQVPQSANQVKKIRKITKEQRVNWNLQKKEKRKINNVIKKTRGAEYEKLQRSIKRLQCSMCGKRETTNNWKQHWNQRHKGHTPRERLICTLSDETCIRQTPWKIGKHTAMDIVNVDKVRLKSGSKLLNFEKALLKRLIKEQKDMRNDIKPIKPKDDQYREEPMKWHWEMRRKKTETEVPLPYGPLYGIQRQVMRLLAEGKKIPYNFRNYGERADESLYNQGHQIGEKTLKNKFYRLRDPTKEDLKFLQFCWDDKDARALTMEQVENGDLDKLYKAKLTTVREESETYGPTTMEHEV